MKGIIVVVSVTSLLLVAGMSGCTEGSAHECGDRAERWQSALERWDANKDGQISKDEFQGADRLFERLDANGDGVLTEGEAQEVPGWLRGGEGQMRAGHGDPAERWKGMLERWDANKDGRVSKEEFQGSDNAFDRLDANSDGVLTEAEAQEVPGWLRGAEGQMRAGHGDPAERWRGMLEHWDANNDGQVSKDEFRGPDEMFDRFDADGDGILTQEEFIAAAGQQRQRQRQAPGVMLMRVMDKDGDERISQVEWMGFFAEADADGDKFVTLTELDAQIKKMAAPPPEDAGADAEAQPAE